MLAPLAGAPLDYQLRAGVSGTYGNFPAYQTQGLDRYYSSAINSDCGKPNNFPVDGSQASQAGGGALDNLFRPIIPTSPPSLAQVSIMNHIKGTPPYPTSDPTGVAPFRTIPPVFTQPGFANQATRDYGADIFRLIR